MPGWRYSVLVLVLAVVSAWYTGDAMGVVIWIMGVCVWALSKGGDHDD